MFLTPSVTDGSFYRIPVLFLYTFDLGTGDICSLEVTENKHSYSTLELLAKVECSCMTSAVNNF